jgi:chromosome segregation ATPase
MDEMENSIKTIALHIKKELDDIRSDMKTLRPSSEFNDSHIRNYAKRIKTLEDSNESIRKSHDSKFVILEDRLRKSISQSQPAGHEHGKKISGIEDRLSDIEGAMAAIDEVKVDIISLEKKLQDLTTRFGQDERYPKEGPTVSALAKEVVEIKKGLEEVSVGIISKDKGIDELKFKMNEYFDEVEKKIGQLDAALSTAKRLEKFDFEKLRQELAQYDRSVKEVESNVEVVATKFLTRELNEFSRMLDRRMPVFVTKEEFSRDISALNQRLKAINAPGTEMLEKKIDFLERRLSEIVLLMRDITGRMPVIVE